METGNIPNTCYEVKRTLLPRPDKDSKQENLQVTETKVLKKKLTNEIQHCRKREYITMEFDFTPGMQD